MTHQTRYERSDDQHRTRRRLSRSLWIAALLLVLVVVLAVLFAVVGGGHDPSQFNHG